MTIQFSGVYFKCVIKPYDRSMRDKMTREMYRQLQKRFGKRLRELCKQRRTKDEANYDMKRAIAEIPQLDNLLEVCEFIDCAF